MHLGCQLIAAGSAVEIAVAIAAARGIVRIEREHFAERAIAAQPLACRLERLQHLAVVADGIGGGLVLRRGPEAAPLGDVAQRHRQLRRCQRLVEAARPQRPWVEALEFQGIGVVAGQQAVPVKQLTHRRHPSAPASDHAAQQSRAASQLIGRRFFLGRFGLVEHPAAQRHDLARLVAMWRAQYRPAARCNAQIDAESQAHDAPPFSTRKRLDWPASIGRMVHGKSVGKPR